RGIMVNSGSSALFLAVELLKPQPGDEIITSAVTFSTDISSMARAGVTPVYVDVIADTYQIDTDQIEAAISPRTKAILAPNLIGNCPDWDVIREIADRHNLMVIEDSCDCLGATLRGTPTGERADMSLTSFALSHIITAMGTGGMICLDDQALIDRALLLRRWGRRSEVKLFGSQKGDKNFFSEIDGIQYDDLFIFDELGWNFEPSEVSAAFGVVQMGKLADNLARRQRNFELLSERFARYPEVFTLPRITDGVDTAWHMFPVLIDPASGVDRGEFQQFMEANRIDTRMVWTGNAARQPAFRDIPHRVAPGGLGEANRVMETGLILPCNHSLTDEACTYIGETLDRFMAGERAAR
ncbi:MAG TPA: aminotransferase class I/II-fold pyridoxal phosphate-dependent enzyme, partial [Ilumatobacteraceae bacterium]|nr:aminotransferase class I/II-fold pyridoxal phosphate-dependent enzyme [Ilumatobacteraceae bacterium]